MIKPIANRIIVKNIKEETRTSNGLILVSENTDMISKLEVVSVSKEIEDIKKGDFVFVDKKQGLSLTYNENSLMIFNYEDVLGVEISG